MITRQKNFDNIHKGKKRKRKKIMSKSDEKKQVYKCNHLKTQ